MMLYTSCFGGIVVVLLFDINVHCFSGKRLKLITNLFVSANFFSFDRFVILFKEWTLWKMSSGNSVAMACIVFTIHVGR